MKRAVITGVAAAGAAALIAAGLHLRREREWESGGDRVDVRAAVEIATGETFDEVAERLGAAAGQTERDDSADQTVVVRVDWAGAEPDGELEVMLLDARVTPPKLLAADGGWAANGGTGSNWAGAYGVLAGRYDWLSRVSADETATAAVGAAATESGSVTAWFHQPDEGSIPLRDAGQELIVALVRMDGDGEVRWARRIAG